MKKILFILDWSSPWNDQLRYVVTDSRFSSRNYVRICPYLGCRAVKTGPTFDIWKTASSISRHNILVAFLVN